MAALPYQIKELFGARAIKTPPFSAYSGPWLASSSKEKAHGRLAEYEHRLSSLIEQLPRHEILDLKLDPSIQNALPFAWQGYDISVLYTYTMQIDQVGDRPSEQFNRTVRKALSSQDYNIIHVDEDPFFEKLTAWNHNLSKKELAQVKRINGALEQHLNLIRLGSVRMGNLEAILLAFVSQRTLYLLTSGVNKTDASNMGFHQMVAFIIEQYHEKFDRIDFMGSMQKEIAFGFRALSAIPQPYLRIKKGGSTWLNRFNPF